jgi:hypothetical protein
MYINHQVLTFIFHSTGGGAFCLYHQNIGSKTLDIDGKFDTSTLCIFSAANLIDSGTLTD